nr:MAG TPA: hypothetical protein [Caudoviricetes sp.]
MSLFQQYTHFHSSVLPHSLALGPQPRAFLCAYYKYCVTMT